MTMDDNNGYGPQPFASATYTPAGQLNTLSWGQWTETDTYNSLNQLTNQSIPNIFEGNANFGLSYNYSSTQNNGRIVSSSDAYTGENTSYTYDVVLPGKNPLSDTTTSLAAMGLSVGVACALSNVAGGVRRGIALMGAGAVLVALAVFTVRLIGFWHDGHGAQSFGSATYTAAGKSTSYRGDRSRRPTRTTA